MLVRLAFAVLACVVAAVAAPSRADACLGDPFPTTPTPPTFTVDVADAATGLPLSPDRFRIELWREACTDGSGNLAVLARITPQTSAPFVCNINAFAVQAGIQIGLLLQTASGGSVCSDLFVPVTVRLVPRFQQPDLDARAAFTFIYNALPTSSQVEIPAAGSPAPAPALPSVAVQLPGCQTCHAGDRLVIQLRLVNPGPEVLTELKFGARTADGTPFNLLGRHHEELLPGSSDAVRTLMDGPFPDGVPAGVYTVEAAILEPELGVTLSRSTATLTVP
jgi:hypothetical protein